FGKSALLLSLPCQVNDQPPVWSAILSAPAPTTSTRPLLERGSAPRSFLRSTSDFRTASRASARDAGSLIAVAGGWGPVAGEASNRPLRSLARMMRDTAS